MQKKIISEVSNLLKQLPGIGPKTAERLTYFMLENGNYIDNLVVELSNMKQKVKKCDLCNNFSDNNPCEICSDEKRDKKLLCIVEHYQEMYAIEGTGSFNGLYYILGTAIEPLKGKFPKDLNLEKLFQRLKNAGIEEIILATDLDTEGEITADYIKKSIRDAGYDNIKFSRIAKGLPYGFEIEYADNMTLSYALKHRIEV
ncbi:MAG: recombination mediator RecR [Endomicrobiia bacterium]